MRTLNEINLLGVWVSSLIWCGCFLVIKHGREECYHTEFKSCNIERLSIYHKTNTAPYAIYSDEQRSALRGPNKEAQVQFTIKERSKRMVTKPKYLLGSLSLYLFFIPLWLLYKYVKFKNHTSSSLLVTTKVNLHRIMFNLQFLLLVYSFVIYHEKTGMRKVAR